MVLRFKVRLRAGAVNLLDELQVCLVGQRGRQLLIGPHVEEPLAAAAVRVER